MSEAGADTRIPQGPSRGQRTPTSAVMSSDAALVAAQVEGQLYVWDRASGAQRASLKVDHFFRGCLTGRALVTVMSEGIKVWRGPRFTRAVSLKTPRVLAMGRATLSADGSRAAAFYPKDGGVGDPDAVGVWDAATGASLATVGLDGARVQGAVLSDNGRTLAVFGDRPGQEAVLRVWTLARRGVKEVLRWSAGSDRTTYSAAFAPSGKLLALGAGERLLLWDMTSRRLIAQAPTAKIKELFPPELRRIPFSFPGVHQMAFSADGTQLVTLHGFGVVGVARWRVSPLGPTAWIKRPTTGGTMRQVTWDAKGVPWLITSTYAPQVWVFVARGDRFDQVRVLSPVRRDGQ